MPDLIVNLGFGRVKFDAQASGRVATVQERRTVRATLRTVARDSVPLLKRIIWSLHMGQLLSFRQAPPGVDDTY
jgi:hypothetical protein